MVIVKSHIKSFWWKVKVWLACVRNGHDTFHTVHRVTYRPTKETYCKRCFKRVQNPRFK